MGSYSVKTPKEYIESVNNGIITKEILVDCLYSVNKRAKNCRDKEREYRQEYRNNYYSRYHKWDNAHSYSCKKDEYYDYKEILLSIVKPVCIHREQHGFERKRIRDIDDRKEYIKHLKANDYVWRNSYFDYEDCIEVNFVDIELLDKPKYRYYLFYDFGVEHTFHTPIDNPDEYRDLAIIDIDKLDTVGHDIHDLLSMQFVKKVISLIESGVYSYRG